MPPTLQLAFALLAYALLGTLPPVIAEHALVERQRSLALRSPLGRQLFFHLRAPLVFAVVGMVVSFATVQIAGFVIITFLCVWYASSKLVVFDVLALQRLDTLAAAGSREKALALANRIASSTHRLTPPTWARFCLAASHSVSAIDLAEAEKLASRCDDASVVGASAWAVSHAIAIYRVALGRYEEARAILDARTGEAPSPDLAAQRELLSARIDASTGKASRALETAKKKEGSDWDAIRAHAFAAQGKSDEAREALLRIKRDQGVAALQQIADRKGPAAAIAASLTQASAYR